MLSIPAYKYLTGKGVTIIIDFISWQEHHPHHSCYITPTWCLLIPAFVERQYIVQAWDHEGTVLYHAPRGWDRATAVMPKKFQVPHDAIALPPPGCHYAPREPSSAPFPPRFIRHQDSLNKDWRDFKVQNPEVTKHETPVGLLHVGKPGRVKTNWFLSAQTLTGVADMKIYLSMFARSGSNVDPNISKKVYANQPCFVTWTTDQLDTTGRVPCYGWSLVIFPVEMESPNGNQQNLIAAGFHHLRPTLW